MEKKKLGFFSVEIYREGLRNTRLMATVLGTITIVLSVLSAIAFAVSKQNSLDVVQEDIYKSMLSIVLAYTLVAPIILIFRQFNYLFSRKKADYYDSFPYSKKRKFVSLILATLTYTTVTIILSVLTSTLIFAFNFNVDLIVIINCVVAMIMSTLISISCCVIAVSITGRAISGLAVAGMIMFIPGVLSWAYLNMLEQFTSSFKYVFAEYLTPAANNLLIKTFVANNGDVSKILTPTSLIYSLILVAIYFVVAYFLFKKRASETAGYSTTSRTVQNGMRWIVSGIYLFGVILVSKQRDSFDLSGSYDLTNIIIMLGLFFVMYFVFEIVTTRGAKTVVKSLKTIWVPVAIAVVLFGANFLNGYVLDKNAHINPQNVESFKIYSVGNDSVSYFGVMPAYSDLSKITFTDRDLINRITQRIITNSSNNSIYVQRENSGVSQSVMKIEADATSEMAVDFKTKQGSKKRLVRITISDIKSMEKYILADKSRVAKIYSINSFNVEAANVIGESLLFSNKQADKIAFEKIYTQEYNQFILRVKNLRKIGEYAIDSTQENSAKNRTGFNFLLNGFVNNESKYSINPRQSFYVDSNFPKSCEFILNMINRQNGKLELPGKSADFISLQVEFANENLISASYSKDEPKKKTNDKKLIVKTIELCKYINKIYESNKIVNVKHDYVVVNFSGPNVLNQTDSRTVAVNITKKQHAKILEILKNWR